MKRLMRIAAPMIGACVVLAGALWLLPSDVVESYYPTLESAQQASLFERGWLPDVLPPSSSKIQVTNHLDSNTSWGSFELAPNEWKLLEKSLSAGAPPTAPFADWEGTVGKHQKEGARAWHHRSDDTIWVFFCKQEVAQCEYVMWMPRAV